MSQPTLIDIPGILLRTTLRLIARIIFMLAGLLLLGGIALTLLCLFLATWRSPRTKKWELAANIVLLATELVKDRRHVSKTDSE